VHSGCLPTWRGGHAPRPLWIRQWEAIGSWTLYKRILRNFYDETSGLDGALKALNHTFPSQPDQSIHSGRTRTCDKSVVDARRVTDVLHKSRSSAIAERPRDALYQLKCSTVVWITQTDRVSAWAALSATATFYSTTCLIVLYTHRRSRSSAIAQRACDAPCHTDYT